MGNSCWGGEARAAIGGFHSALYLYRVQNMKLFTKSQGGCFCPPLPGSAIICFHVELLFFPLSSTFVLTARGDMQDELGRQLAF